MSKYFICLEVRKSINNSYRQFEIKLNILHIGHTRLTHGLLCQKMFNHHYEKMHKTETNSLILPQGMPRKWGMYISGMKNI